jgi:hypothetical protein
MKRAMWGLGERDTVGGPDRRETARAVIECARKHSADPTTGRMQRHRVEQSVDDLDRLASGTAGAPPPAPSSASGLIDPAAPFTAKAWVRAAHGLGYRMRVSRDAQTGE